ncbi:MerR family transcriptional regulator [Conexibacter woesei]|uniref:Transcriptional regulator, MerR family n=1 Tax=Conexibacter woesei (strain DSM 14684 / CCUG 47730 / CIP 108061 / JCM 11494 / NBRC 100937 / ID131577) TaxID=469383 RepID=D3FA68_CONWI|nr:MerR family transcriptional regulator [Conexibacter woesei]ADB53163.1 transcriptional regulator, MerR family [Conexibacter woesei DSM 14684]
MSEQATGELTIDELARETGMTVRNIRAHQSRGLLPPPEVRARTGYYGPEHVARLRMIQEMQADGFNLKAIERLVAASNGAPQPVLDFGRAALSAFSEEEPELISAQELQERIGGPDAKAERKAERLGIIRAVGDGMYEIPSPTLLRAGTELVEMGVPAMHVLAVADQIQRHSRAIAETFARLFIVDVAGGKLDAHTRPAGEWAELADALARLRPLATEAVAAGFQQEMTRVVEREFAKALRKS